MPRNSLIYYKWSKSVINEANQSIGVEGIGFQCALDEHGNRIVNIIRKRDLIEIQILNYILVFVSKEIMSL